MASRALTYSVVAVLVVVTTSIVAESIKTWVYSFRKYLERFSRKRFWSRQVAGRACEAAIECELSTSLCVGSVTAPVELIVHLEKSEIWWPACRLVHLVIRFKPRIRHIPAEFAWL
jgi:hypothetical protein